MAMQIWTKKYKKNMEHYENLITQTNQGLNMMVIVPM
jgi:hypothetical protein